jgi:hypothetical protein
MNDKENYDDGLHAMLQALPQPEPTAELDQAILAQAEKELGTEQAANDKHYLFFKKSFVQRHRVALGLAATVLIAANLVLMEPVERPAPQPEAAAAMEVPLLAEPGVARPHAPLPEIVAPAPAMDSSAAPSVAASPPEPRPAPPARPQPGAVAAVEAAPAAVAEAPPPPPAPAAAAPVARDEVLARSRAAMKEEMAKARAVPMAQSLADTPDAALNRIITLEQLGDRIALARAWQAFRRSYPNHPVEDSLRARLDALPAPPPED